jgi:diguanylate cyclase (GGDEF)-like protein/PAS domain S-box-containing protein
VSTVGGAQIDLTNTAPLADKTRSGGEMTEDQGCSSSEEERERFRIILGLTSTVAWEYDLKRGRLLLPGPARRMAGIDPAGDEVSIPAFRKRLHPDDRERVTSSLAAGLKGEVADSEYDFRVSDDSGGWRWIHNRMHLVRDGDGRPERLVGVGMDVTAEHRAEEALARSERAYRLALDSMTDAFIATDGAGRVTDWNPAAEQMYGWTREEILGKPIVETLSPPDHHRRWGQLAGRGLVLPETRLRGYAAEAIGVRKDGSEFPVEIQATSVAVEDERCLQVFVRDISERKAAEAELARLALLDSLTGLPNRNLLMDRMLGAVGRIERRPGRIAVLFIDLDRFKVVNDSLGHSTGDRLLCTVGERLSRIVRSSDTVARFGGDEIVVLCEDVADEAEAAALAEQILAAVSEPLRLDNGREVVLTASIGIAMTDSPRTEPGALIRDADAAMYRAKERGRARLEMFDDEMRARAMAQLELESDLRHALSCEELSLSYQPVVSLADGGVRGVEALVRWNHPTRGVLPPGSFVPLAEETGMIVPIGTWVLEEACRQMARWERERSPLSRLTVAVNLSARQLAQQDLAGIVAEALARHAVEPARLCLEITETALLEGASTTTANLHLLRDLGLQVLVDDFGTGFASLSYLRSFTIDGIKLDASFVAGVGQNPTDTAIIEGVVYIARELHLKVVAEGVEREDQLHALRTVGCDLGQGLYWSSATTPGRLPHVVERLDSGHSHAYPPRS